MRITAPDGFGAALVEGVALDDPRLAEEVRGLLWEHGVVCLRLGRGSPTTSTGPSSPWSGR